MAVGIPLWEEFSSRSVLLLAWLELPEGIWHVWLTYEDASARGQLAHPPVFLKINIASA